MSIKHLKYINRLKDILVSQNLKVVFETHDLIIVENENNSIYKLQLVISEPIDIEMHGSHNGNIVDGIGVFSFAWPDTDNTPEYFVMAFENLTNRNAEFVMIESSELFRRLEARKRIYENQAYFWLWMMDDLKVYETTNISLEGEWYFLSKGNRRVIA